MIVVQLLHLTFGFETSWKGARANVRCAARASVRGMQSIVAAIGAVAANSDRIPNG